MVASVAAARRSARATAAPRRFVPGGSAQTPEAVEDMVHGIAVECAKAASLPLSPSAVAELERSLGPALEAFYTAACAEAKSRGSDEVEEKDFEAVLDAYKKHRKSKGATKGAKRAGK